MGEKYCVKLYNNEEFDFIYMKKTEITNIFSPENWKREENLQYKTIPFVYSHEDNYIAFYRENGLRKDYCLYCTNKILFEKIKEKKLMFFNPDDNFTRIHFMELLGKYELDYLYTHQSLKSILIDNLSSKYTEYFMLEDKRILAVLNAYMGQLFMNKNELLLLRKMEAG